MVLDGYANGTQYGFGNDAHCIHYFRIVARLLKPPIGAHLDAEDPPPALRGLFAGLLVEYFHVDRYCR